MCLCAYLIRLLAKLKEYQMEGDIFYSLTPWQHSQQLICQTQARPKRTQYRLTTPLRASMAELSIHAHHPSAHCPQTTIRLKQNQERHSIRGLQAENSHKYRLDTLRKRHFGRTLKVHDESKVIENLYRSIEEYRLSKQGRKRQNRGRSTKIVFQKKSSHKRYCNIGLLNLDRYSEMPQHANCYQYPTNKSYFCFNRRVK